MWGPETLGFQRNLFPEAAAKDGARLPQVAASGNPSRDPPMWGSCGGAQALHSGTEGRDVTLERPGHRSAPYFPHELESTSLA